jgi:hypothetical protein
MVRVLLDEVVGQVLIPLDLGDVAALPESERVDLAHLPGSQDLEDEDDFLAVVEGPAADRAGVEDQPLVRRLRIEGLAGESEAGNEGRVEVLDRAQVVGGRIRRVAQVGCGHRQDDNRLDSSENLGCIDEGSAVGVAESVTAVILLADLGDVSGALEEERRRVPLQHAAGGTGACPRPGVLALIGVVAVGSEGSEIRRLQDHLLFLDEAIVEGSTADRLGREIDPHPEVVSQVLAGPLVGVAVVLVVQERRGGVRVECHHEAVGHSPTGLAESVLFGAPEEVGPQRGWLCAVWVAGEIAERRHGLAEQFLLLAGVGSVVVGEAVVDLVPGVPGIGADGIAFHGRVLQEWNRTKQPRVRKTGTTLGEMDRESRIGIVGHSPQKRLPFGIVLAPVRRHSRPSDGPRLTATGNNPTDRRGLQDRRRSLVRSEQAEAKVPFAPVRRAPNCSQGLPLDEGRHARCGSRHAGLHPRACFAEATAMERQGSGREGRRLRRAKADARQTWQAILPTSQRNDRAILRSCLRHRRGERHVATRTRERHEAAPDDGRHEEPLDVHAGDHWNRGSEEPAGAPRSSANCLD